MKIIKFEEIYRDDMIFTVLQAKDALGRKPTINPDLLDIKANYLDCNDMFWLAIDENDRVVGCIGCSRITDTDQAFLHRLYIKPSLNERESAQSYLIRQSYGCVKTVLLFQKYIWGHQKSSGLNLMFFIRNTDI